MGGLLIKDMQSVHLYERAGSRSPLFVDLKNGRRLKWVQSGGQAGYQQLYLFYITIRALAAEHSSGAAPTKVEEEPMLAVPMESPAETFEFAVAGKAGKKRIIGGGILLLALLLCIVAIKKGGMGGMVWGALPLIIIGGILFRKSGVTEVVTLKASALVSKIYGKISFDKIRSAEACSEQVKPAPVVSPVRIYYLKVTLYSGEIIRWKLKGNFSEDKEYHSFNRFRETLPRVIKAYQEKKSVGSL